MSGKVVHVLGAHKYDEYVGRPSPRHDLAGSDLCNPHGIGRDGDREQVLRLFEMGIRVLVETDPAWRRRVAGVRDKTLACWCVGKNEMLTTRDETVCHAQIVLQVAEEVS